MYLPRSLMFKILFGIATVISCTNDGDEDISNGHLEKDCSQSLIKYPLKRCHLSRIAINSLN